MPPKKKRKSGLPKVLILNRPKWLIEFEHSLQKQTLETKEDRIQVAIEASALSIKNGGGPFGALVYDLHKHRIVSVGVNLVVQGHCSHLHAEMVAIALAQLRKDSFDLGDVPSPGIELSSSCEPCAMCMGGIFWSGVKSLLYAALDEDARSIGFDEGPKSPDWIDYYNKKGIKTESGISRKAAKHVLDSYLANAGQIYNPS